MYGILPRFLLFFFFQRKYKAIAIKTTTITDVVQATGTIITISVMESSSSSSVALLFVVSDGPSVGISSITTTEKIICNAVTYMTFAIDIIGGQGPSNKVHYELLPKMSKVMLC